MKICYFGSDYPPTGGGISTYNVEWLNSVSNSSEVDCVKAFFFGNKNPRYEKLNNKASISTERTSNFFVVGLKILFYIFQNKDADVLHSMYVFPVGFWMVLWSKIFRIPSIITVYGTDICSTEGTSLTRFFKRFSLEKADKIIAISQFTKRAAIKYAFLGNDPGKIEVVYISVPVVKTDKNRDDILKTISELRKKYFINEKDFLVLSVCRLVPRKGVEYLINSFLEIKDGDVKLFIVGGGPEEDKIKKEIIRLGLEDRVFVLGKVPDLVPLYQMSDVLVMSSFSRVEEGDFEGLGLVMLEAQSYGKPVVGTDSGGIPETFKNGVTGILVKEKDTSGIAGALEKLYKDKAVYKKMSLATTDFLNKRFSQKGMLGDYLKIIRSLEN